MKKVFIVSILVLSHSLFTFCKAQYAILRNFSGANGSTPNGSLTISANKLYGMTEYGGQYHGGEVFSFDTNGLNNTNLHYFYNDSINGVSPRSNLTRGGNKFFGVTYFGGINHEGNIFSIDTDGGNYKDLWDFDAGGDTNGSGPWGSLIFVQGKLYGMTVYGGINRDGNIFSIDTDGSRYKDLFDFNNTNGWGPSGSLILIRGRLYGMTEEAGAGGDGLIFSIDTNGSGYNDLHDFDGTHGRNPLGSLIVLGGKLYGMAENGGLNNDGVIFSLDTNGSNYRDIFDFNLTNGGNPNGSLTYSSGVLYGMTQAGGVHHDGIIFSIDTNGNNFRDMIDFNGANGSQPNGDLTLVGAKLYGMTAAGGANGPGCIFSLDTNGSNYSLMHSFLGKPDGNSPMGSLIFSGGILYGTTSAGGLFNCGTIIFIDTNGNNYNKIFDFDKPTSSGEVPYGSLTLFKGKLYGMTSSGGINEQGNIFSVDTNGANYKDIWDFNDTGINGAVPYGSLIIAKGKLYGTTLAGGANNDGNIFSIDTLGNEYKNLWSFNENLDTNGAASFGDLTLVGDKLYGMTRYGGRNDYGNIFCIDTNGNRYKDLWDFNDTVGINGQNPYGSLIIVGHKLYGMTYEGGRGYGLIFSMDTNGSGYKDMYDFKGRLGANPSGNLIYSAGKFYGMTSLGGGNNVGCVFTIDTNGSSYRDMFDFSMANGENPYGSLTISGSTLFGMTSAGGAGNYGVVFKIDTSAVSSVNQVTLNPGRVSLYPNPNNGRFTIQLANSHRLTANSQIDIYNTLGEKIANSQWPSANSQMQIDLSAQPAGVYLYRLISENGDLVSTGKFIIEP